MEHVWPATRSVSHALVPPTTNVPHVQIIQRQDLAIIITGTFAWRPVLTVTLRTTLLKCALLVLLSAAAAFPMRYALHVLQDPIS